MIKHVTITFCLFFIMILAKAQTNNPVADPDAIVPQNRYVVYQLHIDKKPAFVLLAYKKLKTFKSKKDENILPDTVEKAE